MCTTNYHRETEQGQFHTGESMSPWDDEGAGTKREESNEASRLLAGVMRDMQTLSAIAGTEMAFKDYRSLA